MIIDFSKIPFSSSFVKRLKLYLGSYVGTFVDDLKNGQGTFLYANGDIYVGTFVDDARTGQGKYTWAAGDEYEGEFRDNAISGQGTYRFASGRTYTGQFENNEIVKDAATADTAA